MGLTVHCTASNSLLLKQTGIQVWCFSTSSRKLYQYFPALPLKEWNLYLKVQFIFIAKCISVAKFGKFTFDAMGWHENKALNVS